MPHRDLLADLTEAQREAVTHTEGPLLILAAAGSGKTRVITRRVAHLLQLGVRAGNILAITFTNKAAGEMRQRVEDLAPAIASGSARFTASATVCCASTPITSISTATSLFTICRIAVGFSRWPWKTPASTITVSRPTPSAPPSAKPKTSCSAPNATRQEPTTFTVRRWRGVYPIYEKRLRDSNALDFDDLLLWPAFAFATTPNCGPNSTRAFAMFSLTNIKIPIMRNTPSRGLSIDNPNLCVVGDPDQSIYKFRGSDIRNILDFERDFPNARTLTLAMNYPARRPFFSRPAP